MMPSALWVFNSSFSEQGRKNSHHLQASRSGENLRLSGRSRNSLQAEGVVLPQEWELGKDQLLPHVV